MGCESEYVGCYGIYCISDHYRGCIGGGSILKFVVPIFTITVVLLLASMFGTVNAVEVHKNGFGGITPFNNTGLTIFNDSLMRSADYESDSLVLSAEFSILETNGDIRDFSLFDNDLTLQNTTPQGPIFVDSTFRTGLETFNVGILNLNTTSVADAFVEQGLPDNNYGSNVNLLVRSFGALNRRTFVQWDLSSIPSTAIITEALMWLDKTADVGVFPRTYEVQAVSASWTEGGITWNNAPGVLVPPSPSISITYSDIWYTWDITTIVQNWIDGTWTNNGLRVRDTVESSGLEITSFFDSKEATNDPFLNISYTMGQWAQAPHSESLDMEETNVSLIWWGQIRDVGTKFITGKGCSSSVGYVYGLLLDSQNKLRAQVSSGACASDVISTNIILSTNRTYGIGIVFEDTPSGADVHLWLDGEWIYNETSTQRVGDSGSDFYVGRSQDSDESLFCNCTHDEILVFKERLTNDTMKLLTTKQHDIVIKSGPGVTPQGFAGLFFALPWLIVFGLLGWLFYIIAMAWREPFTGE